MSWPKSQSSLRKFTKTSNFNTRRLRLKEAGHTVDVIGPKAGETYVGKHGYPQKSEKVASAVKAEDYDLIVIPGGSSPDHMRRDGAMVKLVRDAAAKKIPMAAICHGPWMLCSTDALRGRRCTSYMSIVHDVVNAGGKWVDEECVVDGPIITAHARMICRLSCRRSCNW